ncbi:hypothetical protein SFRURICE_004271 [Spodoptera frugiperda]|nr:hypothetical protein SFRURICE_004271 [Spodoptera frugiperda]
MTFIDTLSTSRKESSLYRRAAQTRSFLSWVHVAGVAALPTSSCKPRSMFKPDSGGAEQRIAAAHL